MIDGTYRIIGKISANHRELKIGDEIYLKADEFGNVRGPLVDWDHMFTDIGFILCPESQPKIEGKSNMEAYADWVKTVLEPV
ncbi:hypothetical protein UGMREWDR_CDS0162 [Aeromonas phage GomatiRiver_11]|nr:hypothetical protein OBDJBBDK_00153 [Aeromonas phage AhFM11]WKW84329.1 hypothetical protein UGMREWDR_CDS0162 [Aeromonas phage GomatiRiver_11]